MIKYIISLFFCHSITFPVSGQVTTDNFTSDDRNVLTGLQISVAQLNVKLDEYQKQTQLQFVNVQKQFDSLQKQLDNHQTFLYWGFGILISFMGFILGFVLWDRRTILAPVVKEAEELKRRENKILDILRAYAEQEPKLREVLKNAGML